MVDDIPVVTNLPMAASLSIAMPLWNGFDNDSRVLKEATTLVAAGHHVTVFALNRAPGQPRAVLPNGLAVCRFGSGGQVAKAGFVVRSARGPFARARHIASRLATQLRMALAIAMTRPDVVHAHDVNTLPLGFLAAKLCGARIVYDAHEFSLGRVGYTRWRPVLRLIEGCLVPRVDGMITTTSMNARAYARLFSRPRPTPLENRPPYVPRHDATPQPTLRDRLAVADGVPILLYQGGIQGGRGLHMLVNAMAHVPHGVLVLLGNGRLTEELRGLSSRLGVADRVFFLPAVPLADLPAITASADIGVHPLEDNCLNHRWASPNKLYEYVHAGLPVVASDLPAMAAVIRAHDIGACFRADDAMDLARVLSRFVEDGSLRQHHADRARAAAPQLAWENEAPKLLALYETLGS